MMDRNINQEHSIMAHTIDAQVSGMMAAMDSSAEREVPPEFGCKADLREAWLEGYDSLATAMLNQRPGVMEAPTSADKPERKPRQKAAKTVTAASKPSPQPVPVHRAMSAILEEQYAGHP
jgi:hypothetical protein